MLTKKIVFFRTEIYIITALLLFFFSYQSSGQSLQWDVDYAVETQSNNESYAVALDINGNVYVTGMSDPHSTQGCTTDVSIATVKYNSSGVQQWVKRYSGCSSTGQDNDAGLSIATVTIDNNTYVYVTGRTNNSGSRDFVTIKYDEDGNEEWSPPGKIY